MTYFPKGFVTPVPVQVKGRDFTIDVPLSEGGAIKRTVQGAEHELVRGVTAKRWTFIIGRDKKIIYRNEAVNAETDTDEVLNFIKLQASR